MIILVINCPVNLNIFTTINVAFANVTVRKAALTLTEKWRKSADKCGAFDMVFIDLLNTSDSLLNELLLLSLMLTNYTWFGIMNYLQSSN